MSFDTKPDQTTDKLTFNVGDRSFDAESAATKIAAADNHITTIESENQGYKDTIAALEAQVAQGTKIDEALAKLNTQQQSQESQTPEVTPSVSEEQIGAIATKQIEDFLANQRVEQNQASALELAQKTFQETGEKLTAIYGDKTDEAMAAKAVELGISTTQIFEMAKNPATANMLLASMKASNPVNQAAPSGSFNTSGIPHAAPDKFVDYSKGVTSSSVMEALQKAGATYN
ncbi:MAG: hypothetical protein OCD76_07380 [Reichenbachiella sp.]